MRWLIIALVATALMAQRPGIGVGSGGGSGGGGGTGTLDNFQQNIAITQGGGSEVSALFYTVESTSWAVASCSVNLAIAPTVQSMIFDIQTRAGISIFSSTTLVVPVGQLTATFQTGLGAALAKGTLIRSLVTQNDSPAGLGQFAHIQCH